MKKDNWQKLEDYISLRLKEIDPYARPTKASGGSTEKGDSYNNVGLAISCKQSSKLINMPIDMNWWKEILNWIPLHVKKTPVLVTENKEGKRFATLELDDFLNLFIKFYKQEHNL